MEGRISTHFYSLQSYHLAFGTSYLNGGDWVKQFITRVLHITHSQWIFRNFTLHDKRRGVLVNKEKREMLVRIESLAGTNPDEIPEESKFLLEFDLDMLCKSDLDTQTYWVVAMEAARSAGRRIACSGARQRRLAQTRRHRLSRRTRLGITEVERQIRTERRDSPAAERLAESLRNQPTLISLARRRDHPASLFADMKSNKRLRKPD